MEQIKTSTIREIPVGTYPGITGGYVSEFKINNVAYRAEFANAVKGSGYSDAISVDYAGEICSSILGCAINLKRMKIIWEDI